ESSFGRPTFQFCERGFIIAILCFRNAMYEYAGNCKKRNQHLEMAHVATVCNDCHCLCCGTCGVSIFKIKRINYDTDTIGFNNICARGGLYDKKVCLEPF